MGFKKERIWGKMVLMDGGLYWGAYFSILVNGTSRGFFRSFRGLRLGDPLSPFIFSLVANGLSAILRKAGHQSLMKGFA